jgi:hypothetical protein
VDTIVTDGIGVLKTGSPDAYKSLRAMKLD